MTGFMQGNALAKTGGIKEEQTAARTASPPPTGEEQPAERRNMLGDWVMHIYIGDRVFHDQVHLEVDGRGKTAGTLTVPGLFTAEVERFQMASDGFSFQITIDEGRGRVTIRYEGVLHASGLAFSGFATALAGKGGKPADERLVGGFTGQPAHLAPPEPKPAPAVKPSAGVGLQESGRKK